MFFRARGPPRPTSASEGSSSYDVNPGPTPSSTGINTPKGSPSRSDSSESFDTLAADLNNALSQIKDTCVPTPGKTVLIRCVSCKTVMTALMDDEMTKEGWHPVVNKALDGVGCASWTIEEQDGWLRFRCTSNSGHLSHFGDGERERLSGSEKRARSCYTATLVKGGGYVLQQRCGEALRPMIMGKDKLGRDRMIIYPSRGKIEDGTVVEFVEVRK